MASLLDVILKRLFHMEVEIRTQQSEPEPNADQHQGQTPGNPETSKLTSLFTDWKGDDMEDNQLGNALNTLETAWPQPFSRSPMKMADRLL